MKSKILTILVTLGVCAIVTLIAYSISPLPDGRPSEPASSEITESQASFAEPPPSGNITGASSDTSPSQTSSETGEREQPVASRQKEVSKPASAPVSGTPLKTPATESSQALASDCKPPESPAEQSTPEIPVAVPETPAPGVTEIPYTGIVEEELSAAEVDAILEDAIAYAKSKGMEWYEGFSIEKSGYFPPAYSKDGEEIFRRDIYGLVDHVYELSVTDSYYVPGNPIYYKIVRGPCEDLGGWFGYVLY